MRTYAAFSLLALASGTAMAAPTSPDLSRDVGFSSMPNSPDMSGGSDMATFPSMAATPDSEDSGSDPLGSGLSGTKNADLAKKPALLGRAGQALREYEKWVGHQKRSKLDKIILAARDAEDSEEAPEEDGTAPTSDQNAQPAAVPGLPPTGNQEDEQPQTGDEMPDIPGVEKLVMIDGIAGNEGVKIDTLESAKKNSMPALKNLGPSRMTHRRRDLRTALEQLHVDDGAQAGDTEMPSKAKQLATLSRKVRRAPMAQPVNDLVLHSDGLVLPDLPEMPKSPQTA